MRRTALLVAATALGCLAARAEPVLAQQPVRGDTLLRIQLDVPSPRGAMVRSFLVPGWGQAASGSYLRGGVYFTATYGSWFMLLKTLGKLAEARDVEERRVAFVRDSLFTAALTDPELAELLEDPFELEERIGESGRVQDTRALVGAREQQREDWIALVIFWTLAGAVDAYVTTQLADFPGEITAAPAGDRLLIGYSVPLRFLP